jgi:hypothetical protein
LTRVVGRRKRVCSERFGNDVLFGVEIVQAVAREYSLLLLCLLDQRG